MGEFPAWKFWSLNTGQWVEGEGGESELALDMSCAKRGPEAKKEKGTVA